jgi:hypothetical protein
VRRSGRHALGLVSAGFLVLMASSAPAAGVAQPPPTTTPGAPGIEVALADFDLPDPYLVDAGGRYYLYLSTALADRSQNIPLLQGRPGHWSRSSTDAVPKLPRWATPRPSAGGLSWEPEVYRIGRIYLMYFSPTIRNSLPVQHCVALATSRSPSGPFAVQSRPLVCQRSMGGDIDAQVVVDRNGPDGSTRPNYLIWKSDNNSTQGDGIPRIWAQRLSNNGRHLVGQAVVIYMPDQVWQQHLIEAPQMALAPDGSVWLFFSAGLNYSGPDYAIGVVRCVGPLGPCSGGDAQPFIGSNLQGPGPGEETYFKAKDGSDWLLYSPWYTRNPVVPLRPVEAARIGWSAAGPYVAAAGTFPSP